MKIANVEIVDRDIVIECNAFDEVFSISNKFEMEFKGEKHYFTLFSIYACNSTWIKYKLKEVGYWANFFYKMKKLDIRELVNMELSLVSDLDTLNKIEKESHWC